MVGQKPMVPYYTHKGSQIALSRQIASLSTHRNNTLRRSIKTEWKEASAPLSLGSHDRRSAQEEYSLTFSCIGAKQGKSEAVGRALKQGQRGGGPKVAEGRKWPRTECGPKVCHINQTDFRAPSYLV